MNGKLKIEPATRRIVMDRTFAKFYCDTTSEEYKHLQSVRADYPNFSVVRRRIRKNTKQEHYAGLDYAYMEAYIRKYESEETVETVLEEFEELKFVSKCHSRHRRYPVIRKWFLDKYPKVDELFKQKNQDEKKQEQEQVDQTEPEYEDVLPPLSVVDGEQSEQRA